MLLRVPCILLTCFLLGADATPRRPALTGSLPGCTPLECAIQRRDAQLIERFASDSMLTRLRPDIWDAIYEAVHRNDRSLLESLLKVRIVPGPEITQLRNRAPRVAAFASALNRLRSIHLSAAQRYAVLLGRDDLAAMFDAILDAERPWSEPLRMAMTDEEERLHLMMIAARFEDVERFARYAEGADVNERDLAGQTALMNAARCGNLAVCRWLIERGADPNIQEGPRTALHGAVEFGYDEIVAALLEAGADPNVSPATDNRPPGGFQPWYIPTSLLDSAVIRGDVKIASQLLDAGAELNAPVQHAHTTITLRFAAASHNAEAMVELLLPASRKRDDHIASVGAGLAAARSIEVVQMLLDEDGVDVHTSHPRQGLTALHGAARRGRLDIVGFLLEQGADSNLRSSDGSAPLHSAVSSGRVEVVEALLEAGADPNAFHRNIGTPLKWALGRISHWELTELPAERRLMILALLEAGADPDYRLNWQVETGIRSHYRWRAQSSPGPVLKEIVELLDRFSPTRDE